MKLPRPITFDWNKGNIDKNRESHKVHNKEAEEVFFNKPVKIYRDVSHSQIKERYTVLGITDQNRRLYITFTIRDSKIRVISARDQNVVERRMYEKK